MVRAHCGGHPDQLGQTGPRDLTALRRRNSRPAQPHARIIRQAATKRAIPREDSLRSIAVPTLTTTDRDGYATRPELASWWSYTGEPDERGTAPFGEDQRWFGGPNDDAYLITVSARPSVINDVTWRWTTAPETRGDVVVTHRDSGQVTVVTDTVALPVALRSILTPITFETPADVARLIAWDVSLDSVTGPATSREAAEL